MKDLKNKNIKNKSFELSIISVADFLININTTLLSHTGRIQGEVTSINKNYSTAIYFTIKDTQKDALLNCIIWRSTYKQNGVDLEVGDEIIVTGTPEIYAARGAFSLKTQTIEYAGEGALKKSYDELKKKLTVEGLLDTKRKRILLDYPKKIGVITSKSGVVIQDFNSNLGRYGFETTMVDSRVEGKDAIHELLAALKTMSKQDLDVLVIMRGGGSWESLQAFNTESVVRAVATFNCPVVTGIGHDTDVTLVELVADVGASTPTAVAEVLNETWDNLINSLESAKSHILNSYQRYILDSIKSIDAQGNFLFRSYEQSLTCCSSQIYKSITRIHTQYRMIENIITHTREMFQRVVSLMKKEIKTIKLHIDNSQKVLPQKFLLLLNKSYRQITLSSNKMITNQYSVIKLVNQALREIEKNIKLSDPSRNLKLGYSLTYSNGKLIRSIKDVSVGEVVNTQMHDGDFTSEIKNVI